jgi:ankyrin repeat protein
VETARWLLARGVKVTARALDGTTALHPPPPEVILRQSSSCSMPRRRERGRREGTTALMLAAEQGTVETVQALLKQRQSECDQRKR